MAAATTTTAALTATIKRQQGFTLLELMVVVVIVAVLLAVGMMSFGRSESSQIRQTLVQSQALVQGLCDQSAFNQALYFLAVDESGLIPYRQKQGAWQKTTDLNPLVWPSNLRIAWVADALQAERLALPSDGWLCWPGGMVTPGSLIINERYVSWSESLRFELK